MTEVLWLMLVKTLVGAEVGSGPFSLKWGESRSVMSDSLRPHGLYSPWNSLVQNAGVGSLSLLQGIFPTQGSNSSLPHCRQILYQLNHKESPRILEWVAYPFSCRSSWPRDQTGVSCIAGGFFTNWTIGKASRESGQESIHCRGVIDRSLIWFLLVRIWLRCEASSLRRPCS